MEKGLSISGQVEGKTMSLEWNKPASVSSFQLRIDKCNQDHCYTVLNEKTADTNLIITDTIYSQCTVYDVRLRGLNEYYHTVHRTEIMLQKSFSECYVSEDIIIGIGFTVLGLLILGAGVCAYYYHKKHPIHKLTRVRSRLYSRLYSQERYQIPISKESLQDVVQNECNNANPFQQEFDRLERMCADTLQRKTTVAELASNKKRNRYNDIVPFDSTRVRVLPPYKIDGDEEASDYINASFISDVRDGTPNKYIAAQGPGDDTTPAFWSLIWQYDVRVVVMLTAMVDSRGVKFNSYWPTTLGERKKYKDISVQLFDVAEAPTYVVRKFDLTKQHCSTNRVIVHIQYTQWPDRLAPSSCQELIQLVQLTRVMYNQFANKTCETQSPILVHCSAGVGRSGTYICVDQLMSALDSNLSSEIDVYHTVYQLRRDRRYMVQTKAQYEFCYRCIAKYQRQRQKEESSQASIV